MVEKKKLLSTILWTEGGTRGGWRCANCWNARFSTPLRIYMPQKCKKHRKTKKMADTMASSWRRSPWCLTFCFPFYFLEVFSTLAQKCQNPWKKKTKNKKKSPHVRCPASQTFSMGRNCLFFCFLFSRGFCNLVSPTASVAQLLWCLFSWFLEEMFTLTTSIGKAFTPPHLLHWIADFGYWAIKENADENISITHLFRFQALHCIDVFFGMLMFWLLTFRGLTRVLWTCNIYIT